jgi:DNA-binding response OmpR family regulator
LQGKKASGEVSVRWGWGSAARRARVLVVDDDAIIRRFLVEALTDDGYEVREAGDGGQALAILGDWRPNLIVLDLMMPVLDGWEFLAQQRHLAHLADIPVLVLSAAHRVQDTALDAAAVFAKPFDLDEVLASAKRLIRARRPALEAVS